MALSDRRVDRSDADGSFAVGLGVLWKEEGVGGVCVGVLLLTNHPATRLEAEHQQLQTLWV